VKLEGDNKISCECGFYEHMGMLCRHTLKVSDELLNWICKSVAMYEKFCDELFESGSFAIFKSINASEFILVDTKNEEEIEAKHFRVKLEGDNKISCECGFYEHMGMLCRHTLKVLVHLDKMEIPAGNIMRRWTKEGGHTM